MEVLTSFEFNGVKAVVALRAALLIKSTLSSFEVTDFLLKSINTAPSASLPSAVGALSVHCQCTRCVLSVRSHGAGLVLTSHHQWAVSTPSLRTQYAFSTMSVHRQCAVSTLTSLSALSALTSLTALTVMPARWQRCQHADSDVSAMSARCQHCQHAVSALSALKSVLIWYNL